MGGPVLFTVVATGTAPLSYQWQFNGVPIPGANAATLQISSCTAANAGAYVVLVSNSAGNILSTAASLTVTPGTATAENPVLALETAGHHFSIPHSPALCPADAFSLEAWVFPLGGGGTIQTVLGKSDGASGNTDRSYELVWYTKGGNAPGPVPRIEANLFFNRSDWCAVGAPMAAGTWTHVAVTYERSSGEVALYLNGERAASLTRFADGRAIAGSVLRPSSQPILIGRLGYPGIPNWALMRCDEVRLWDHRRTPEEIHAGYNCKVGGAEPGLIACWSFDDLTGRDVSGHGHDGTLLGGARVVSPTASQIPLGDRCGWKPVQFRAGRNRFVAPGLFRLEMETPAATVVRLEVSEDLFTWRLLTNLIPVDGSVLWTDPGGTSTPTRFYRAFVP